MSADGRTDKKRWTCTYESARLTGSDERARVRQDLAHGREPQPVYATGKMWND